MGEAFFKKRPRPPAFLLKFTTRPVLIARRFLRFFQID
jgi:hypothetical protein